MRKLCKTTDHMIMWLWPNAYMLWWAHYSEALCRANSIAFPQCLALLDLAESFLWIPRLKAILVPYKCLRIPPLPMASFIFLAQYYLQFTKLELIRSLAKLVLQKNNKWLPKPFFLVQTNSWAVATWNALACVRKSWQALLPPSGYSNEDQLRLFHEAAPDSAK